MTKQSYFRLTFFLLMMVVANELFAATIVFRIRTKPPNSGKIFLASGINGWNPANPAFALTNDSIAVETKTGTLLEYKFTQGSWDSEELNADGSGVANRRLQVNGDTVVFVDIARWKKPGAELPVKSTACEHVTVIDSAMYLPQLNRYRRVSVHLPPDYFTSNKKYAVLYVNDGQNCFDLRTAPFGEWKIDEAMDSLYKATGWSAIVVAIDHGGDKRLTEYNTNDFARTGKGEGTAYLKFLTETLKPLIDKRYRTLAGRQYTWIAGSSMGGLISTAALVQYGNVFGGAGVFSPAYWTSQPIYQQVTTTRFPSPTSAFVYVGGKEGESMEPDARKMYALLIGKKEVKAKLLVDPNGTHREAVWAAYFHPFLQFMQSSVNDAKH